MTNISAENTNTERHWGHFRENGFERSEMSIPIGRLSAHEAGSGQPMVMMHGIGGGASSLSWCYVAPMFTATHRVIVPDMIGWGLSEHPARPILFEDYVTGLEAVLEKQGGNAIVVAQSLAAGFALALAERKPNLISELILINPTGLMDFGVNTFPAFVRIVLAPLTKTPGLNLAFYRALFHRRSFMENWYKTQGFANPKAVPDEIIDGAFYGATRPNAAYSALPFLTGDVHYDIVPYLQRAKVPTSIIVGGNSGFVGVRNGKLLADVRTDFNFYTINDTKACPEIERPEAVAHVIRGILRP